MLKRYTDLKVQDFAAVLHLKDNFKVSERRIEEVDWMANKTLKELSLRKEGITVLGIDRKDESYLGLPSGDATILVDDLIIIYGKSDSIKSVFSRKQNFNSEIGHRVSVKNEKKRLEEQNKAV